MDINAMGITGVAAITVICLLIGQAVKASAVDSKWNPIICGVCAGIADYFNIDPSIVRVLWAVLALAAGTGVLAYIACAIILPEGDTEV